MGDNYNLGTSAEKATEPLDPIWGAKAIGEEIHRSPRATFHLLEKGAIPGRKVGNLWVSSRQELRRVLFGQAT